MVCPECARGALDRVRIVAETLKPETRLEEYLIAPCREYGVDIELPVTVEEFLKDFDRYMKGTYEGKEVK